MIDFMTDQYICPVHGLMNLDRCVLCDALKYRKQRKLTLKDEPSENHLPPGPRRRRKDPNPLIIAWRAKQMREKRERTRNKQFKKGWRRFWKGHPRVVRKYPDDLVGGT